jgi:hypothetical protein
MLALELSEVVVLEALVDRTVNIIPSTKNLQMLDDQSIVFKHNHMVIEHVPSQRISCR